MNSEIFAKWFKKNFVPAVKRHQLTQNIPSPKALLLIDNCSAHSEELRSRDGSVTCVFLPPNTTSLIQLIDQGILQAMKTRYKRKLLQKVIYGQDLDPTQNIKEMVKQHTVKDALYMLADAWEEGSSDSISKAFSQLQIHPNGQPTVSQPEQEDISAKTMMEVLSRVGNSEGLSSSDVEAWLNAETELPTTPQMSDEQILASVAEQSVEEDEVTSDEEDEGQDENIVSNFEAVECFKKCLSWMETQNNVDTIQIMQLRRMMELAVRTRCCSLKQTNLLQHFKRG